MSYHGKLVVAHITRGEKAVDRWLRYSRRLTPEERRRITHGDRASLVRPFPPEWEVGAWLEVATNLWIRPEPPMWRREHYRIPFGVRDFRPRLVRRVPQVYDPPELDRWGEPKAPTAQAIAEAREVGNYTTSRELAIPEEDEAVDDERLELYAAEAGAKRALGDSSRARARLEEIRRLPLGRRIDELTKLAEDRGMRDDVRAFRMRRRVQGDARAAEHLAKRIEGVKAH